MSSPSKAHNADSLSLATRYSLLRGRHLSMQKFWNERHCNDKKHIEQLEHRNASLLEMLQIAQNEINRLKQSTHHKQEEPTMTKAQDKEKEDKEKKTAHTHTNTRVLDLEDEYKKVLTHKVNKSMQRESLFYEILRECLFLSDPYNMRVLLKRSKRSSSKNEILQQQKQNSNSDSRIPLQSALSTILKVRKQMDYECDCFAIHYNLNMSYSIATRLILMRNSLIICGVGVSSKYSHSNDGIANGSISQLNTLANIEIELYTIAGIYICNNDPYSYCNSMIIACSTDLTVAAHGVNPLLQDKEKNIMRYQFNIFSDSKQLIHSLTERLPDYVWHINEKSHSNIHCNPQHMHHRVYEAKHDDEHRMLNGDIDASSSMVGRLGAGLYAGITGVVMDPIRGGQNDGMKGFLRGIASGISGVAIKPITHFRSNTNTPGASISDIDATNANTNKNNTNVLSPPIAIGIHVNTAEQKEEINTNHQIKSALIIPDSPLVFQADSVSESESIASSTITTNTLDSSKSEKSTNINLNNNQSQIFTKHKLMQRRQYLQLSAIDSKKESNTIQTQLQPPHNAKTTK